MKPPHTLTNTSGQMGSNLTTNIFRYNVTPATVCFRVLELLSVGKILRHHLNFQAENNLKSYIFPVQNILHNIIWVKIDLRNLKNLYGAFVRQKVTYDINIYHCMK